MKTSLILKPGLWGPVMTSRTLVLWVLFVFWLKNVLKTEREGQQKNNNIYIYINRWCSERWKKRPSAVVTLLHLRALFHCRSSTPVLPSVPLFPSSSSSCLHDDVQRNNYRNQLKKMETLLLHASRCAQPGWNPKNKRMKSRSVPDVWCFNSFPVKFPVWIVLA